MDRVEKKRKYRVALAFGGRSPEHEVSITTAASIAKEADPERIEIVPIYISREGRWLELESAERLARLAGHLVREGELEGLVRREVLLRGSSEENALVPVGGGAQRSSGLPAQPIDVLFPALHGQGGEDGTIQGLARLAGVPCVGAGVLGSALGMDKVSMKRIVREAGVRVPQFVAFTRSEWAADRRAICERIVKVLPFPVFVKPSGAGSSVGITKVAAADVAALERAVEDAIPYDYRILVEQGIADARELEVALLGNDEARVSVVGEIVPGAEFYDYEAKYIDEGSQVVIPAQVPAETAEEARRTAAQVWGLLDLSGMARADFLLEGTTGLLYFNEVNTIPGFTPISMYPMLWKASGVEYRDLITILVQLAVERQESTRTWTSRPAPGRST
ncbi:MAG: D-alanine--D-alanine ligase family protein [Candidatus Eisenbacteria bacterium]|nr:D-alanine--D-alanine ligase family protein [Candidatus Eisenbacteria bacterium]